MIFKELINLIDENKVVKYIIDNKNLQLDSNTIKYNYLKVINELKNIEPKKYSNEDVLIVIEENFYEDDEEYDSSYLDDCYETTDVFCIVNNNFNEKCSFELSEWNNILSFNIDDTQLQTYGYDVFAAHVLWEMTFWGFSQDDIQKIAKAEYIEKDFIKYSSVEDFIESFCLPKDVDLK